MAAVHCGVSKIQQVVHQARNVFLNSARIQSVQDSGFAADLDKLKQLVCTITAEDLNVKASLAAEQWDYHPFVTNAPAACMEVFECPNFSIGIFLLKPHQTIPLHDHPGMHGIMKILFGSVTITSYTRYFPDSDAPATAEFLARFSSQKKMTIASELCCLYPHEGNIHEIQADSEPVAFLDILGPPYNPKLGRDCSYYFKQNRKTTSNNTVYLKIGPNPEWFSCVPLKHDKIVD